MKIRLTSFTFLIVCSISLFFISIRINAQETLKQGYVVSNTGDSVKGFLRYDEEKKLNHEVFFSAVQDKSSLKKYDQKQITAFAFYDGNIFQLMKYKDADSLYHYIFAKALLKGFYNVYDFYKNEKENFLVTSTFNDKIFLLYDDIANAKGEIFERGNYQNQLLFLSLNCETIKKNVDRVRYNDNDILEFVSSVNKCLDSSNSSAIIYKKSKTKINVYAYAGGLPIAKEKFEYTGRIIARFLFPSIDKKVSLNVGVNYMVNQYKKTDKIQIFSVPFTIQYNFLKGIIQPYIDAGLSFDFKKEPKSFSNNNGGFQDKYGVGFSIATGLEVPVLKQLWIKGDWRYELLTHYPTIGLVYWFK